MAISPDTKPIEFPQGVSEAKALNQVQPVRSLPVRQIAGAAQRLGKRVAASRDALHTIQEKIAEQEVDPSNAQNFNLAIEGIRNRINQIAESEDIQNQLPAIRREARKFAEIRSRFNQNREAIGESLDNLNDAEGLSDRHRNLLRRQIMEGAEVQLNEDNIPTAESISSVRRFQDAQDPREYLQDRLSKVREVTLRNISPGPNGSIRKSELSRRGRRRLEQQGLRELGFGLQDSEKGLEAKNLVQVRETTPEVQRWLDRQRAVHAISIANRLESEGLERGSEEFNDKLEKRVQQAMGDEVLSMVRTAAQRNISGDQQPDISFESIPGAGGQSESENGRATRAGTVARSLSESEKKFIEETEIKNRVAKNDNISMDEYREMKKVEDNASPSTTGILGMGTIPGQQTKIIENEYSPEKVAAFKRIRQEEEDMKTMSIESPAYTFADNDNATEKIQELSLDAISSPQADKAEIQALLANSNNFRPVRMTTVDGELLIEVRPEEEFTGQDNLEVGQNVAIRVPQQRAVFGTDEKTQVEGLLEGLPEDVSQRMKNSLRVGNKEFGREWTDVGNGIGVRIESVSSDREGAVSQGSPIRYTPQADGEKVTFGNVGKRLTNNIPDEPRREMLSDLADAARKDSEIKDKVREVTNGGQGINMDLMSEVLIGWYENRDSLSEAEHEIAEFITQQPIPSFEPGQAEAWGNQLKILKQLQ